MSGELALRWSWTIFTGFGLVFALWNLREVLIDNVVSSASKRPGVDLLKLQTRGEVWNHALISVILVAHFLAGISALVAWSLGALSFLLLSAAAAVALSLTQTRRRQRIFRHLRLRRGTTDGK